MSTPEEPAAALPHLRVQETHGPIGVLGTDVGPFVRCSCGMNPTPKYWLMKHWVGDPEVGKRLVSQFLPGPHPRPVVDREALIAAIKGESPEVVWDDAIATSAADRVLALLPTEEGEADCNCYPGGFSPETYEGPQHHCPVHGHGTDLPVAECPKCEVERLDVPVDPAVLVENVRKLGRGESL